MQLFYTIMVEMKKNSFWELIRFVFSVAAITFILMRFVLLPCVVQGDSMYPYLHDGNYGFSFIFTRNININRFDIAVIKVKDEKLLVKRVIGLPGEQISYKDNKLYVNGVYVEEPFLENNVNTTDLEIKLSENEYYCLGDNRNISRDSRYYGPFSSDIILSTHLFVLYPFKNIGFK